MATTVQTLVNRTRVKLADWPSLGTLSVSCTAGANTVSVNDGTLFTPNKLIEIGAEVLRVSSVSVNDLTVQRGQWGSVAATHASGDSVLVHPRFLSVQIIDVLADGIDAAWPRIYKRVTDTSLTTLASTYEYTIPGM